MDQEFKRWTRLLRAIEAGTKIELDGYILNDSFRSNLEKFVKLCLENYNKNDLAPVVYSVIQEMLLRATVSNLREYFCQENGIDFFDQNSFDSSEEQFRKFLNTLDLKAVRDSLKSKDLFLKVIIRHNHTGLAAEVFNNSKSIPFIEERLRKYLASAMEYKNLMDYYNSYPEDKEGRNLGLAFSILMLRETGLKPELLRISSRNDVHISRLEIPFGEEYKSIRKQILKSSIFTNENQEPELPWKTSRCSYCGRTVDDRIFFSKIPEDIPVKGIPEPVRSGNGICAWCFSSYLT
ncbi:hypothetical protein KQY10_04635 [Leptospira interrogans]|uniref:Uncharacterized protein n=6 Tax=Leptospira interrogans TaxID=173 RepID=A0AAP9WGT6_LEPIR|nr:hypothetical protein [Leptospira interrogans]EMG11760.1 hypothetical protein LEP1GSC151_3779 [Leptospira interrogans serovar Grippotyphosa str. LT2186]EMM95650.1 hypothetical protein LEP1GSC158_5181 [Leptospira interrogans serovar Zanoni str. LT2156]EMN70626.1 hypothetical protein LEP1GSC100_0148 [Leptospira interrogans serovar Bataviae str. UI 08561]AKP24821.1 hypothetical protein LIMLP_01910 [Leptospira interrogans serovar Manilae]AKP28605.1 hypothetical protein LIMHP_01905 [Leptospira in